MIGWSLQTVADHNFEGEDTEGLIGYDFLKFFDVYLDCRHNMIFLALNNMAKSNSGKHIPDK